MNRDFTTRHKVKLELNKQYRIYICDKNKNGEQKILYNNSELLELDLQPSEAELFRIEEPEQLPHTIIYKIIE